MKNKNGEINQREIHLISGKIVKMLEKDNNDKISLEEFVNGTKNNGTLREILFPSDLWFFHLFIIC